MRRLSLFLAAVAVSAAALVAYIALRPGDAASTPQASIQQVAAAGSGLSSRVAHPHAIQPVAGMPAQTSAPETIVGDPNAHAPSLAQIKRQLKILNMCGGATSSAFATPVVAAHGSGFIPDPGTQQTEGQLPLLTRQLDALGRALGVTIYGISGYRTPAHSVAVGGFADDPHTKGLAEDIGVGSLLRSSAAQISEAELARFGLYRPFDPSGDPNNTEVNHIQLIPTGGPLSLAQATAAFNPDPRCR